MSRRTILNKSTFSFNYYSSWDSSGREIETEESQPVVLHEKCIQQRQTSLIAYLAFFGSSSLLRSSGPILFLIQGTKVSTLLPWGVALLIATERLSKKILKSKKQLLVAEKNEFEYHDKSSSLSRYQWMHILSVCAFFITFLTSFLNFNTIGRIE